MSSICVCLALAALTEFGSEYPLWPIPLRGETFYSLSETMLMERSTLWSSTWRSATWKDRPRVMPTDTLTCQELVELVTDYLEGALRPTERARFEAHIAQCQHCPNYLDQMRTTIRLLGRMTTESLSPAARHELLARFFSLTQLTVTLGPVNGQISGNNLSDDQ
jgi:hypothetical protein